MEQYHYATFGVSASGFFSELALYLNEKFTHYDVLLRLNCEGVEDAVVYSAYSNFGAKLKLICGSLKDVEQKKGIKALRKLEKFLKEKELLFTYFSAQLWSWLKAHKAVLNLLKK